MIRYFKILIRVVFIAVFIGFFSYDVFGAYLVGISNGNNCPVGACNDKGCNQGAVGVKIGDYCYDCGLDDGTCPNSYIANTCDQVYYVDPDCAEELCQDRDSPNECTIKIGK